MPRPAYSPAALTLMAAGLTLDDIAGELQMTRQAVSQHLWARTVRPPINLGEVLTRLGGAELAARVLAAIEAQRERG